MPKLSVLTPKRLIKILEQLGFQLDHSTGSHFVFFDSTKKRRAVVPFHTKDLPKGTMLSILKQELKQELMKEFITPILRESKDREGEYRPEFVKKVLKAEKGKIKYTFGSKTFLKMLF